MKKLLRITWLVVAFIVLFPIIALMEAWWLVRCIKASLSIGETVRTGFGYWMQYLKEGIVLNKDFVINGL